MPARSRLKPSVSDVSPIFSNSSTPSFPSAQERQARSLRGPQVSFNPTYLKRLPTLLLAFVWYGCVWYIVNHIPPEQIQNWPVTRLYAPFQITLFLGNWLTFSYLFLNSRRGLVVAFFLQTLVFLRLQQVHFQWQITLGLLAFFAIIEVVGTWLEKRETTKKSDANFQKTFHRRRRTPSRSVSQRFG